MVVIDPLFRRVVHVGFTDSKSGGFQLVMGVPQPWMVYEGKSHENMDDF